MELRRVTGFESMAGHGEAVRIELGQKIRSEIVYYSLAVLVYIGLGVVLTNLVLNFVVGPLFFIGWMWVVPPLWERWRQR